jgi:hypothetical protein
MGQLRLPPVSPDNSALLGIEVKKDASPSGNGKVDRQRCFPDPAFLGDQSERFHPCTPSLVRRFSAAERQTFRTACVHTFTCDERRRNCQA